MPSSLRLLHSSELPPANPSARVQSNQSSCNDENDAKDNDDACFLFGPVLALGEIVQGAGGEGKGGGWDGGHGCVGDECCIETVVYQTS